MLYDRQTDGQTDICDSGVAFANEKDVSCIFKKNNHRLFSTSFIIKNLKEDSEKILDLIAVFHFLFLDDVLTVEQKCRLLSMSIRITRV